MATKHITNHRKEVNEAGNDALVKMLGDRREAIKNFRFGVSGAKVKDVKHSRILKRDIARILTKLNSEKVVGSK